MKEIWGFSEDLKPIVLLQKNVNNNADNDNNYDADNNNSKFKFISFVFSQIYLVDKPVSDCETYVLVP